MRKWLMFIVFLYSLLATSSLLWAQNNVFEPSPYVFKITAANCLVEPSQRIQTGFQIKNQIGIFTALHGVAGCKTIIAATGENGSDYRDLIETWSQIKIDKNRMPC